jgi:hypothetical protein
MESSRTMTTTLKGQFNTRREAELGHVREVVEILERRSPSMAISA